jgi:hypothetical protein
VTPNQLHQRLLELRLTQCPWVDFTSSTARVAIEGYEGVIAGRHQGRPVTLEGAYLIVYGEEMWPKVRRKRA